MTQKARTLVELKNISADSFDELESQIKDYILSNMNRELFVEAFPTIELMKGKYLTTLLVFTYKSVEGI